MSSKNGKPLRFATLVRVSTEKQAEKGESVRTQTANLNEDVEHLQGKIVARYEGQEHATPGYEKKLLDGLLDDAKAGKFDAVIVAHADRWSRDNAKSKAGLEIFRGAGIRFFVRTFEYDLFNPTHRLFLGMSAEIGEFTAGTQSLKSVENKIARARRGIPTSGKKPIGRVFDRETGKWYVDKKIQKVYQEIAERYLGGESLPTLCDEFSLNHSNVCRNLRNRCGSNWEIEFKVDRFKLHEVVPITVPPLLSDKLIRSVQQRLDANRTYLHKPPTPQNTYLLGGRIFCAHCGYTMVGQMNKGNRRYYRHAHNRAGMRCKITNPRPWIPADGPYAIEEQVIHQLFNTFGNKAAIERAIKAGIPQYDKLLERQERIEAGLEKIERTRKRLIGLVAKELITDADAEHQLAELKGREQKLRDQQNRIGEIQVPDSKAIRYYVEQIEEAIFLMDDERNTYVGGNDVGSYLAMSPDDRRSLIDKVFALPQLDGKPAGVYISVIPGKQRQYRYELRGQVFADSLPRASY